MTLQQLQLATFDQIWDYPVKWIDEPNQNRGGWSGVGRLEVLHQNKPVVLYIKKQLNHTTRTFMHPIKGVPTFAKEFEVIRYLASHGVNVPQVVFFAQQDVPEGQQAILVTEVLEGYQSLDILTENRKKMMMLSEQRNLTAAIADALKRMHALGIQHRALYSKHVFVKQCAETFEIALIDLEKSRYMLLPKLQALSDLITFNYRSLGWNTPSRLHFFKCYYAIDRMSLFDKLLCKWVSYKTSRKQRLWKHKNG